MKSSIYVLAAVGLFCFWSLAYAVGGGISGGGGDNLNDDAGAAWFLGSDRVIHSCFELAPDFGASSETVKREIEGAFLGWQQYIDRKFRFADIKLGLATKITVAPKCTGTEDLVLYFGTVNDEIRKSKAQYNNPTAFAFKRAYDIEKHWGQGFIWIASQGSVFPDEHFPDWSLKGPIEMPSGKNQPYALRAILLHEVGHILGNPHVSGTIMTERISEFLRHESESWARTRIDQSRELSVCWQCEYEWNGDLTIDGADPYANSAPSRMRRENFEILTGHPAKTDFFVSTVRKTLQPDHTVKVVLELYDLNEKYSFPIEFAHDPVGAINYTLVQDSAPIFKRLFQITPVVGVMSEKVKGMVSYGTLTTAKGKRVTVIVERNLPVPESSHSSAPPTQSGMDFRADFRIRMFAAGKLRPLFEANWLQLIPMPTPGLSR